MLSFAYKRFDGKAPQPGHLDAEDRALLSRIEGGFEAVGDLYSACSIPNAPSQNIGMAMPVLADK